MNELDAIAKELDKIMLDESMFKQLNEQTMLSFIHDLKQTPFTDLNVQSMQIFNKPRKLPWKIRFVLWLDKVRRKFSKYGR